MTIDLRSRPIVNPQSNLLPVGQGQCIEITASRYHVDPWSKGETDCPRCNTLVTQSYKQSYKQVYVLLSGRGRQFVVVCFLDTSGHVYAVRRLDGICHEYIAGLVVNNVGLGWVGAPITSAPRSDFMMKSLVPPIDANRGISQLRIQHFAGVVSGMLAEDMPGKIFREKLKVQKKKEDVRTRIRGN